MAKAKSKVRLDTKTARRSLAARRKPYYVKIAKGLDLGYYRSPKSARWVMRGYVGEGKYTTEFFADADDGERTADGEHVLDFWQAQDRAKTLYTARRNGDDEPARTGPYTVADCMADYIAYLREYKKTADDVKARSDAHIIPALGSIECDRLTTRKLTNWLHALAKSPPRLRTKKGKDQKFRDFDGDDPEAVRRRRASARRTWNMLKAALNRGFKAKPKRIESDEAWRTVEVWKNVDKARVRWLTVAECRRLINACQPDLRDLVRGALATGARYGELASLKVADYDRDNKLVRVHGSKTDTPRHIYLNDEGEALFDRVTAGQPGDRYMFRRADGGRWMKSMQLRPFAAAVKRAKIDPPANFHALRHTYASLAIMGGAPLLVVAQNLGHKDTRMVEKHYGHLAREYVADTIRKTAPTFGIKEPETVERLEAAR